MSDDQLQQLDTGEHAAVLDDVQKLVFEDLVREVFECNNRNGWFDKSRSVGDEIALIHSEASEALEEFRSQRMTTVFRYGTEGNYHYEISQDYDGEVGKPVGFPAEIADILVRVFDTCKRHNIDIVQEFRQVMRYNWTRGYRHGYKET